VAWAERKQVGVDQAVQQTCTGMDEWNSKFFVNDKETYTTIPRSRSCGFEGDKLEAGRLYGATNLSLE